MNIWIINHFAIPPSLGGLVRHYYFSKYLQEKGHNVRIFASSHIHNSNKNMIQGKDLYIKEEVDGIEYIFVRNMDYTGNGIKRILNMFDFLPKLRKTLKIFLDQETPDVIYTSTPDLFTVDAALKFGKKHQIPVVVEVRDLWPESIVEYYNIKHKNPLFEILFRLERSLYIRADKLVFTIPGGKEYLKDKGWNNKIDESKIYHINNGVDLTEFEYNRTHFVTDDTDLNDDTAFKVVYMGSVRFANHLSTLIEAASVLKDKGENNIKILVYGEGPEREELQKECKRMGVNVFFKGHVPKKKIPYILAQSNLNLINVKKTNIIKYGCSWNKLFEYMASGKPVLSNLPVAYDLISKDNLGVACEFKNSEEYADMILRFKNMSEDDYTFYCSNAKKAVKEYDYRVLSDKVETVCKKAIEDAKVK